MDMIRLGNTGLKVSRLCLGCMTYGSSKWRPWVLDEEASLPFFKPFRGCPPPATRVATYGVRSACDSRRLRRCEDR